MLESSLLSLVALLITMFAGLFTSFIAKKKTEQDKIQQEIFVYRKLTGF